MSEELDELRERAAQHGRSGSYGTEAIAVNRRILELEPRDIDALLRLVRCYEARDDWSSVCECYARLLDLGVDDGERIRAKLDQAQERVRAQEEKVRRARERESERQAREEEAKRRFDEEVRAIESFTEARDLAIAAREADKLPLAMHYHDRSLELATLGERPGALAAKAATLRVLRRPADALKTLRESIELDPSRGSNKPAYTSLVAVLRELGRLDEARDEGEALLAVHPDDPFVLNAVGRVYVALFQDGGDATLLEQAERHYKRAAELRPQDRAVLERLREIMTLYKELGREADARRLERHLAKVGDRSLRV